MNATMIGTTRYMSPERLRGKPYTMSSDVWSLGLVLLECLLGDCPFESISSVVSYSCRTKKHIELTNQLTPQHVLAGGTCSDSG
jgi:serine/threonine protein kinase